MSDVDKVQSQKQESDRTSSFLSAISSLLFGNPESLLSLESGLSKYSEYFLVEQTCTYFADFFSKYRFLFISRKARLNLVHKLHIISSFIYVSKESLVSLLVGHFYLLDMRQQTTGLMVQLKQQSIPGQDSTFSIFFLSAHLYLI